MQKIFFSVLVSLIFLSSLTTSCVKETIREITRDTTIIIRDTTIIIRDTTIIEKDTTIIRSPTTIELITGKWNTVHHEIETYLGTVLSNKKVEYFTGFYLDLKADGNYSVNNQEGITSGKWEMASANNLLLDKNTTSERYFYVLFIEPKTLALRGPFKKNGEMKLNYLTTTYYQKQ
jgi:hypothetical protein